MKNFRLILIFLSFFLALIFLYAVFLFLSIAKPKYYIKPYTLKKETAVRGNIYTKNYTLAKSEKNYGIYVYPDFLDKDKIDLFYNLFSIYTNIPAEKLKKRVNFYYSKGIKRILLAKVDLKTKQNLLYLRKVLDKNRVFKSNDAGIRRGFEILSLDFKRVYPYKDILEPVLGRYRKDKKKGENGLEEYYNYYLKAKKDGIKKGYRDVLGNIVYDGEAVIKQPINGNDLPLNINLALQRKIELLLSSQKEKFNAKEVVAAVMDTRTGKIIAIASSNRYNPSFITKEDIPNMKISVIREVFEPGSVMKAITFAILLEHNKVNPYEFIKGYNGKWKPKWRKKEAIKDDKAFDWISAENVIVYSSNIGISQLVLRLSANEFLEGLKKFELDKKSGIDLPYEINGKIRSLKLLYYPVYKTTTAYGYGIKVNFMELLKAYNVFNNNGIMVVPKIADVKTEQKRVISAKNANIMLNILRKVVLKGTARKANIKGLFIAGKTGTAHVSKGALGYKEDTYNVSFFGFANDEKNRYTIGVTFFDIKAKWPDYFASNSAVPTFRQIVDIMIKENLLKAVDAK